MAKTIQLEPLGTQVDIPTETDILQALLATKVDVKMACKGKGLCATCHVHITAGADQLTSRTEREERTLKMVGTADSTSRLACQARVLGPGVVITLPQGMYIERAEDLDGLIGKRAGTNILHPIDGSILVPKGKLITRSRVNELRELNEQVRNLDKH
ncbi:2Fe-2S ferredoxin-5 [Planctomycetes bacterium Poly30]|uniref:2Fe-2S ferredoxin-5 n=1 Tax=Saltatorellus ferox TaxID=2528018 RepID=A0A518EKK1_9BACT|nr:2Fe-2S ferredoxin-5 [Planctomycetes bacterium Poly30]